MYETIANFLNVTLIDLPIIYLSVWSIIHFLSGCLLAVIYRLKNLKINKWIFILIILIGFEIFEHSLISIDFFVHTPETMIDIIWDITIGVLGFFLIMKVKNDNSDSST